MQGDFSLGKFNVTLDCCCGRPVGYPTSGLLGTMLGNVRKSWHHPSSKVIRALGRSGPPCFFGPTRVHIPNGISIGSVVFEGLMVITDRQTDRPHYSIAIGCLWLVLHCGLIMYMYCSCCYDTVLWCMFVIKMIICKDTLTIPDPGWSYSWKRLGKTKRLTLWDVLPNIKCTQSTERAKKCRFLSLVTFTFDLDIQTCPSKGPNMSSMWIWSKSVQQFPRYFINKKSQRQRQKQNLMQFTACGKKLKVVIVKSDGSLL